MLMLALLAGGFGSAWRVSAMLPSDDIEAPRQELRGAWLATVWGLDWPSQQGADKATAARQRAELGAIIEKLHSIGINALFFQVRSMADAMYRSNYEPWSRFLTGARGTAPADASWDPLQYAVEKAHSLGMECHAWVNPFRVTNNVSLPNSANDRRMEQLGWLITYRKTQGRTSTSTTILDPGNPAVRDYIADVCRDIISRYDVDGLIFDDYFYPEGLPEGAGYDYDEYMKSGTELSQADWRRNNVAATIAGVRRMIDEVRPEVKFGVSPAGVGGADGLTAAAYGLPRCYAGHDWMHDGIYCDPLHWLAEGSIDYISPQIYWPHDHSTNPYGPIARWWSEVASHFNRHFYSSVSVERLSSSKSHTPHAEATVLIEANRDVSGTDAPGHIFYSVKKLIANDSPIATHPRSYFPEPALTPAMTWRKAVDPGRITGLRHSGKMLSWQPNSARRYSVYALPRSESRMLETGEPPAMKYLLGVSYEPQFDLGKHPSRDMIYVVTPFDLTSREWPGTALFPDGTTAVQDAFSTPANNAAGRRSGVAPSARALTESEAVIADSIDNTVRNIFY